MTPVTVTKITKWGNSQGVVIPKNVCEQAGIAVGDSVTIMVEDGDGLVIKPTGRRFHRTKKLTSEDVLSNWDGTYEPPDDWPVLGAGIDWGEPVGKEMW